MPRRTLKRWIPAAHHFSKHDALKPFGSLIKDPNLWHLNRYSVSTAAFVGLFICFLPLPLQTLMAAGIAILVRCNLPLAMILIWISNPVTMPPMFYATYRFGAWLLGREIQPFHFELSRHWFATQIADTWEPLLVGSLVCGLLAGVLGFVSVQVLWRASVVRRWEQRKHRRTKRPVATRVDSPDDQS